jgi:hypothetical protein
MYTGMERPSYATKHYLRISLELEKKHQVTSKLQVTGRD